MYWLPVILILPYLIILLKRYRSLNRLKPFKITSDPSVFVSVIVACHNEEDNLPSLLESLSIQSYPRELFEVVVVNDNSSDNTFEIARDFKPLSNIRVINNRGAGKKLALRSGIDASKGHFMVTTDADCCMGKEWIRTLAAFYESDKPDMVICPVQLEKGNGFFRRFQELEFLSLQGVTAGFSNSQNAVMCNGANLAFTKEAYLKNSANLHDEINSGDDIFLLHSLKKYPGAKISWLESFDALATARSSRTLRNFLKQRNRWISKSKAYKDYGSIVLGLATFTAIILQAFYAIALLIFPVLIPVFLLVLILKSIPDFLILRNTTTRYGKRSLMNLFLPAQIIYPFYVLLVLFFRNPKSEIRSR